MLTPEFAVLMGFAAAGVLFSWVYLGRYTLPRPPIGVINLWDVAIMLAGVVALPYLYLGLPAAVVLALLGASMLSVLYFTLKPVLAARWATWLAALALVGLDVAAAYRFGAASLPFFVVNNLVMVVAVVGVTNLWAQGGMRAWHAAVLAGALAIYDVVFTWRLPVMSDLFSRLAALPFAPMVAWPAGEGQWLAIGLGDLLLAALAPLVLGRAFGRPAGLAAMALGLATIAGVPLVAAWLGGATFPVMVLLGPVIVLQYLYWRAKHRTWQSAGQFEAAHQRYL
jgi:hypothetical protein